MKKDLSITGSCTGELYANYALMYRAFFNLIENAVKYNQYGGEIQIASKSENGLLIITIADTGCGIPKEEASHIFEPFYRVDKSRSRNIGGSGLGLSIVKNILNKFCAEIQVRDNQPQGTVFEITFLQDSQ